MKVLLITLCMLLFSLVSEACTMCNSKQAADVRALVFGDDFYHNLLFSILPFVVFTGIIVFIYKSGKTLKSYN